MNGPGAPIKDLGLPAKAHLHESGEISFLKHSPTRTLLSIPIASPLSASQASWVDCHEGPLTQQRPLGGGWQVRAGLQLCTQV